MWEGMTTFSCFPTSQILLKQILKLKQKIARLLLFLLFFVVVGGGVRVGIGASVFTCKQERA